MLSNDKPIANPIIVFREEFDDWALLFNPDTDIVCGVRVYPNTLESLPPIDIPVTFIAAVPLFSIVKVSVIVS